MSQTCSSSFSQYFPFKLRKHGQQSSHCSTRRCGQIQRFRQGNETDPEMFEFLECRQQIRYGAAPTVQAPHQDDIDLPAACGFQQFLASFSLRLTGANLADLDRKSVV